MKNSYAIAAITSLALMSIALPALSQEATVDKSVCEFVASNAARLNTSLVFEKMERRKSSPFIRKYLVENVVWSANNTAPKIASPDAVYSGKHQKFYETHIRWSHDMGYLPYLGKWYKVQSRIDSGALRSEASTGTFLSAVLGEQGLICAFDAKVLETAVRTTQNWEREAKHKGLACDKAIEPIRIKRADTPLPDGIMDHLISEMGKDFHKGLFKRNAYISAPFVDGKKMPRTAGPVLKVDINNDGREDTLLRVNFSEAGGSMCGTFYYDLLSGDMLELGDPNLREALFAAQGMTFRDDGQRKLSCGRTSTVISIDGRNYISSDRKLSRYISAVEGNENIKLCVSNFSVKPVIVFDASKIMTTTP